MTVANCCIYYSKVKAWCQAPTRDFHKFFCRSIKFFDINAAVSIKMPATCLQYAVRHLRAPIFRYGVSLGFAEQTDCKKMPPLVCIEWGLFTRLVTVYPSLIGGISAS